MPQSEGLISAVEQVLESARTEEQRKREEQERLAAEQREREEKERLEAHARQKEAQDRLEAERQEREQDEKQPAKRVLLVSASPTPSAAEWLAKAKHYLNAKDYAKALPLCRRPPRLATGKPCTIWASCT
jgi:hypothetical protein